MYSVLWIGIAVPGNNEYMEKFAERAPEFYQGKKGFKSAVYFSDKTRNEYGNISVWETKEDYEANRASFPPELMKSAMEKFAGTLFESRGFYVNNLFSSK